MFTGTVSNVNRRSMIKAAAAGLAVITLPKATSAQDASPESGEWSFTDDKGVTVTLPSRPERIVMDVNAAAPLWDFGIKPTALFGWNVLADGSLGDAGGNIDPEGIAVVGDVNQTINIEELIAIEPDLLVTLTWSPDLPDEYWSLDADADVALDQVRAVAPIVAISATGRADDNTLRFAELAEALGADISTPELAQAKTDFEAAIENFGEVAAENTELSVLFFAPVPDNVYIANPIDWADINMYQELGLNIISPDAEAGGFWETISHEQALKYPSDIIFISTRSEAFSIDEVKESPTWSKHPAVAAGQIFPWNQDFVMSYQGMTQALNDLAEAVSTSEKVTE